MDDLCSPQLSALPETLPITLPPVPVSLQSEISRDDLSFHDGGYGLVSKT